VDRAVQAPNDPATLAEAALVARVWCCDAYRFVSAEAVQLHGGIGFTWEHDAHLYFRRARADAAMLGTVAAAREELAALLAW
jgi:alkylation response protein AidB-like acyl-CoA dehydrogenase